MPKFYTPTRLSENITETPEGYLLCLAVRIGRTGWQVYHESECPLDGDEEGKVSVYRSPEEVFRPETIASFQGKSVTIRHPVDFVKPENWQALTRGTAQNVRRAETPDEDGEESLLADLLITEAVAIGLVKNGLREVSLGYEAEYEQTGDGEGRQSNIIGNHIALVEQGRAGSTYAINDHKGKVKEMPKNLMERLRARFGAKVIDEVIAEDMIAKTTDEDKKDDDKKDDKAKDAGAYDELVKAVKDLGAKVDSMGKGKDEFPLKKDDDKKDDDKSKDEGASLEDRLTALETAVAKLLEAKSGDEKKDDDDKDKSEDEDDDGDETDDEDEEGSETMTGDTAARIEILAPGLKRAKGEDEQKLKARAIDAAYNTKDGKAVLDTFTGGAKPKFDSTEKIDMLFVAASEVLKASRGTGLEGTKDSRKFQTNDNDQVDVGVVTPEKMNEINAKHYGRA